MDPTPNGLDTTRQALDQDLRPKAMLEELRRRMFGLSDVVRIGRFQIIRSLGEGGHGSVFEAYDEQLARAVALKVLNPAMLGADPEGASRRLLREAQALAQLNHPHVVQVYDSGREGDRVWVAIELVRGASLRAWLRDHSPDTAAARLEIFELLRQAGRGLAAAHELGIVHRDFKPENVLVGEDGRVRVADFGLARALTDAEPETIEDLPDRDGDEDDAPLGVLTRTGQILGTPRYMAPEQFGGALTHACDQFAFCVTAWEAMTGHYPYKAKTTPALLSAFTSEAIDQTHAIRLPGAMRRALMRGMSADPAERHPSMAALLEALGDPRRARARRRLAALGLIAVASAGLAGNLASTTNSCNDGSKVAQGAWGPKQRAEVEAAFAATAVGFSESAAQRAVEGLDSRVARWVDLYDEACRVNSGDVAADDYALATGCLRKRLAEIRAVTSVLTEADSTTIANVPTILATVEDLDACSDLATLRAEARQLAANDPPPQAEEWDSRIATIEARIASGHHEESVPELEALLREVTQADHAPAMALTEYILGQIWTNVDRDEATGYLQRGFEHSLAAGDNKTGALIATSLAEVYGYHHGDVARGRQWIAYARSLGKRRPVPALEGDLQQLEALLLRREGRWVEAIDALQATLELPGVPPDRRSDMLENVGRLQMYLGRYADSVDTYANALAFTGSAYGEDHPSYANVLIGAAVADMCTGEVDSALARAQRSLELVLAAGFDPDSSHVAMTMLDAGVIEGIVGDPIRALELLRGVEDVVKRTVDPSTGLLAETTAQIGIALFAAGKPEQALTTLDRSIRQYAAAFDDDAPFVALAHSARGEVLHALGRYQEAEAAHRKSRGGNEADGAAGDIAVDEVNIAAALAAQGRLDKAEPLLVEAVADLERMGYALHYSLAYWRLGQLRLAQGRPQDAIEPLERALEAPSRAGVGKAAIRVDIEAARAAL